MDRNMYSTDFNLINLLCEDLIRIFQDEEGLYLDLIKKEDQKKDAIINHNADKLLKISREQEDSLRIVDTREKERSGIIRKISELFNAGKDLENMSEVAGIPKMPPEMKEKLLHHSYALRELMFTLKNITGTNQEMLEDNKKFFDSLIEDLSGTPGEAYGPRGKTRNSSGPLFVNING
jgi:hypothetical protein